MPLLDHFHGTLADDWPWAGFHSTWATTIASHLNAGILPPDYHAIPHVKAGAAVEIDVATYQTAPPSGGTATAVWTPPRPSMILPVDFVGLPLFEVQIVRRLGGPQLRAAIELVSPANKDRDTHRHAFAVKCASYLQQNVSVVVVDIVTERTANMHAEVLDVLRLETQPPEVALTDLYALAYRTVPLNGSFTLEIWTTPLILQTELPTLPLWIEPDIYVSLPLEVSYMAARTALRIPL